MSGFPALRGSRPHILKYWLGTASAAALLIVPALAYAEDIDAASADGDDGQEIVVTGSAIQNKAEIESRRQSTAIVDTLSRDEIGALPDITIAESLRRITGVTTIYNDDIGQFASIRGVHPDYVPVTLNGLAIATTGDLGEGTRKVNLQVIPGESVRQLQAYKTAAPELDAGALGGLLNIVTVSAFDPSRTLLSLTGGVSYSTYMGVPDDNSYGDGKSSPIGKSFSGMWAPRFGANDEFGLVVTAIYEDRPRTQSNSAFANYLYFNNAGALTTPESADWNGFASPDSFVSHNYTNKFTKFGGTARFEYKPGDAFRTGITGYAYFSDEQETRNTNRVYGLDQARDQTATTGTMRVKNADSQWRYNTFERDQRGVQWDTEAAVGDRGTLTTNIGYSYAWFRSQRPYATFVYKPNTRLSYDLENPDQLFVLDNAAAYQNPANFKSATLYDDSRAATEKLFEGRADYSFNNGVNDRGFGFAVGADGRDLDLSRDNGGTYYVAGTLTMAGRSFIPDFDLPGYSYPGLWLQDPQNFWENTIPTVPVDQAKTSDNGRINDYRYHEQVYAGYLNLTYSTDLFRVDAGARLDHTRFKADMAQVLDGVLQPDQVRKQSRDTNLQPYLTARFSVAPDFRIKGGLSRTLGRPNPETIATVERIDVDELTITRGNADIQPLKSTNYDLGLEYYFNGGQGMFTLTGFYKDIRDDILTVSNTMQIGGETYTVTQPINGEKTKYKGVEVGFINNSFGNVARFLAPVGVSANAVWIDGTSGYFYKGEHRVRDELVYQSKVAANAAVFYAFGGGSELRFAMNHQGRYLEEYAADPWQDLVIAPFTTFDLTGRWAITPRLQLRVEGRNIFSANRQRNTGPDGTYHRAELEVGSSWFVRLNFRL